MKHFYFIVLLALAFTFSSTAQVSDAGTKKYCTYTQWFYGSYFGTACGEVHVDDFIFNLLYEDLVVGSGDNTLTMTQNDVDWLIRRLPGYGPSVELDGTANSSNPTDIQLWKGRFKNTLLSQTITLGLNLRADDYLGHVVLEDTKFKTWKAKDCSDPLSDKIGKAQSYYLSQSVLDHLSTNNTITDLYELANVALSGEDIGTLELWQVTSAVAVINYGFRNGRILKGFYGRHKDSKVDFGDQEMFAMKVYPNPMSSRGTIEFTTMESGLTSIELYSIRGERVEVFMNENTDEFMPIRVDIDTHKYRKGMYILYIRNGSNVYKEKITIVK